MSAVSFHPLIPEMFLFSSQKKQYLNSNFKNKKYLFQTKTHCIASPWTYTYTCIRIIYLYSTSVSKALPCLSGCCLSLLGGLCCLLGDTSTLVGHLHGTWLTLGGCFMCNQMGKCIVHPWLFARPKNSQLPIINDVVSLMKRKINLFDSLAKTKM